MNENIFKQTSKKKHLETLIRKCNSHFDRSNNMLFSFDQKMAKRNPFREACWQQFNFQGTYMNCGKLNAKYGLGLLSEEGVFEPLVAGLFDSRFPEAIRNIRHFFELRRQTDDDILGLISDYEAELAKEMDFAGRGIALDRRARSRDDLNQ